MFVADVQMKFSFEKVIDRKWFRFRWKLQQVLFRVEISNQFFATYNFAQMKIFARKKWNIFAKDQNVRLDIFLQSNTDDEICTQAIV